MLRPVCSGDTDELVLQCLEPRFGVDDRLEVAFEDPAVVDRLRVNSDPGDDSSEDPGCRVFSN